VYLDISFFDVPTAGFHSRLVSVARKVGLDVLLSYQRQLISDCHRGGHLESSKLLTMEVELFPWFLPFLQRSCPLLLPGERCKMTCLVQYRCLGSCYGQ